MNLVKRDEFEVLKKLVQKLLIENEKMHKINKKLVKKKSTSRKKEKNSIKK